MKTSRHHWAFAFVAWVIFIVAFFLPAIDLMPGWKAAILQGLFWQQALEKNPLAIHYLLLTFANVLMVVSPFFKAWGADDARFVKWLRGLSLAATVLVWSFLAPLMAVHMGRDLRYGYYLWATSFVVLCMAALLQPATVKAKAAETA
ncbi:MAG TPA: hypothetical protein VNV43_06905 [Candidatus Acidoferrales bacterium]|jgi:hypothetical protein|nr:hypothetical protein [Candidatus Acidoferrales bacterium]